MTNEAHPLFRPGHEITVRATAAVTGCRLVAVSTTRDTDGLIRAAHCGAGISALGVAAADIPPGQIGPVHRAGILPITAGGTITAGQQVESDGQGRVIPLDQGAPIGQAVESGTVNTTIMVALRGHH